MGIWSSAPIWDIQKDFPDLQGKVIIVTGGNSGLGFATVQHLVRHGAKVYMGARSEEKAKAAIARLDLGSANGSVEWLDLDLSDPREAKKAAQRFLEKETKLDVLMNNAAITVVPYNKSHDDIQDIMMVNHISVFVFTQTLLPVLEKTAKEDGSDVRIVNVSSQAWLNVTDDIRFRNREDFNEEHSGLMAPMKRYGRSKLANILYARELQRRFEEKNIPILCLSLHPGVINTEGNQNFAKRQNWFIRNLFLFISEYFIPTPEKGAYTQVFAAVAPLVREHADTYKGAFLMPPVTLSAPNKPAESKELAKELWETTESLLKEMGVEL